MSHLVSLLRTCLGVSALLFAGACLGANPEPWQLNLAPGATDVSREVYWLHNLVMIICTVIGIVVFSAMGYALVKFRKSKGAVPNTGFTHNLKLETIWTLVPILILISVAWPSTKVLYKMYDTSASEMTVKVTAYQWMWKYEILNYRGETTGVSFISRLDKDSSAARHSDSGIDPASVRDGDFASYLLNVDKPLLLPTNTKIRFVVTADDVIHSWWVPALGWKQDAIPGVINESWTRINEPGTFRGQCAELCGKDHGFMPIVVRAVTPAEFEGWLVAQPNSTFKQAERVAQVASVTPSQG
ncbi:MAG TPA: cytochrome c oxidase subunit II [Chiayiivirga sp.]|nr:cytochrome c oxidase subunit II [Chiayiivirga sp.]